MVTRALARRLVKQHKPTLYIRTNKRVIVRGHWIWNSVSNLVVHTHKPTCLSNLHSASPFAAADGMFQAPVFDINNIGAFMALVCGSAAAS